jgi:hypothetical protein
MVASVIGGPPAVAAVSAAQGDSPEDIAKSYIISEGLNQVLAPTTDPNAVGSATGPDNIDVGGGWNPATGATAAELEAARVSLEQPPVETAPVETAPVETPPPTVEQITSDIAADNIDAGGGWNPATGATEAELAQAKAAMTSNGWTLKQALDAVRAGLLVNLITGDPLGLNGGGGGGGGGTGTTGFAQVPIPAEWKSPTYAAPSAPIDLSSIFSNQNMLGGTQWQGLPSQRNVSFNDIFAAGQQQTPMGTPVDINQIVSAILGQNATS